MAKKNTPTPTLAELQAQRDDLAGRLGAIDGQLQRLDPVNDWSLAARALAEQTALERALSTLGERIHAAELAERTAQRDAQEQARSERAVAARDAMDAAARRYVDALHALPVAELAQAQHEMAAVGGWPSPAASVAIDAARNVDNTLGRLRLLAPSWLGLDAPRPARDVAREEAKAALARAEQRHGELQRTLQAQRYDADGPSVRQDRLDDARQVVDICKRRVAELA